MKKVIFEKSFRAFLATFCFLLLGAVAVSAQSKLTSVPMVPGVSNPPVVPNNPIYTVPQGNFVGSAEATDRLQAAINDIKPLIQGTTEPAAIEAYMTKVSYFVAVRDYIAQGASTANAIAAGLWIFLQDGTGLSGTSNNAQSALKAEVIDLLD